MSSIFEWLLGTSSGELSGHEWYLDFASDHNNYVRLILFALLAALVWLTIHCYRREGTAFRKLRVFLTVLRVTVISIVLMILFQPAVIVEIRDTLYSSVVFLVDDSMSMSFNDHYSKEDQADFRQQLSEQMEVDQEKIRDLARKDILVKRLSCGVIDKLRKDHPVEIMKFSTDSPVGEGGGYTVSLGSLSRLEDGQEPTAGELEALLGKLKSTGFETDHAAALRETLERFQGRRIGAIVVLSDGRPTLEGANLRLDAAVEYAKQRGVPRYSVLIGDPTPPKNLTLLGLRAPREARMGATIDVTAMVGHQNIDPKDGKIRVLLYRRLESEKWPDDFKKINPVAEKEVEVKKPEEGHGPETRNEPIEVKFEIETAAMEKGEYVYRAVVVDRPDELTKKDNFSETFVAISERQLRVLLVSGDAGWEFQYLRNFLLRQPELYRVSVWQQDADPEINQSASTGMKLTRLPRTLGEMIDSGAKSGEGIPPGYHVIILYDPVPTENGFDKKFIDLLKKYVTVHSGGLCYIASNKNTWEIMNDTAAKPLLDLMPVIVDRNREDLSLLSEENAANRSMGFPISLTTYGVDHPVMRLTGNSASNMEIWNMMPGIFWSHAVLEPKSNVRILAVNTDPHRTMGEDKPLPVIAAHSPGKGRVVYMGFDETWRWRQVDNGFYYRRFWGNVIGYLATKSDRRVIINTGGDRFRIGEKITLVVEAFDSDYSPVNTETFVIKRIDMESGDTVEYTLKKDRPGLFRTTIEAENKGRFQLTCKPDFAPEDKVESRQIIVEMPEAEARRPEADPWTMQRLVSRDEFCIGANEVEKLAEIIPSGRRETREKRTYTLWDTRMMLIFLVMLLTVEWFLRKRANLA